MLRRATSSPNATPPAVLWVGYLVIMAGLAAIGVQVVGPPTPPVEPAGPEPAGDPPAGPLITAPPGPPPPPPAASPDPVPVAAPVEQPQARVETRARPAPPEPDHAGPETSMAAPAPSPVGRENLVRGNRELPQVLLSFDGGSGANSSSAILAALENRGVRTTFFLTGTFIRRNPDVVRAIVRAGHEVGNHTDGHPHLTRWGEERSHATRAGVDRALLERELRGAEDAFRRITGLPMAPLWRAPYGEVNREIAGWAAAAGYRHVGWTAGFDSLDWVVDPRSPRYRSPRDFLDVLAGHVSRGPGNLNGAIVLLHLDSRRPEEERFGSHVTEIIDLLHSAGYELVPASTMLANLAPRPPREAAR